MAVTIHLDNLEQATLIVEALNYTAGDEDDLAATVFDHDEPGAAYLHHSAKTRRDLAARIANDLDIDPTDLEGD